jgi:hypothetical protein
LHCDAPVARKLEQEWAFGPLLHWGAHSQVGVTERWPVVWANRTCSNPSIQTKQQIVEFRKKHFATSYIGVLLVP